MIIPGIVSITLKDRKAEEVIAATKEAGLKAIEWSETHHIPKGDIKRAKEIALMTRDEGLEIAGYGSYYRPCQCMDIKENLETAKAMGALQMRIWAGNKPSTEYTKEELNAIIKELQEAVLIAEGYGIQLNLEWHRNTLTDKNLSAKRLLGSVPGLNTLWQPTPELLFQERMEGLEMILPHLSYMHVYTWDKFERLPFVDGIDDWRKYFSTLSKDKRYYALLEFVKGDSVDLLYKDAEILKALVK